MPIILEANYSKKIGLPSYSSHQFMVALRTEIADVNAVAAESDRLYALLQEAVDSSLQKVGYLPGPAPKNGHAQNPTNGRPERWMCSDKQRELILKITNEHHLDKNAVETLAQERFDKSVIMLNKLEASGLIEELLEQTGQNRNNGRRFNGTIPARGA